MHEGTGQANLQDQQWDGDDYYDLSFTTHIYYSVNNKLANKLRSL